MQAFTLATTERAEPTHLGSPSGRHSGNARTRGLCRMNSHACIPALLPVVFLAVLLMVLVPRASGLRPQSAEKADFLQALLERMTLEEKAGQLGAPQI